MKGLTLKWLLRLAPTFCSLIDHIFISIIFRKKLYYHSFEVLEELELAPITLVVPEMSYLKTRNLCNTFRLYITLRQQFRERNMIGFRAIHKPMLIIKL